MSNHSEVGPNSYKLVLIASMPRCGSMWAYNVVRKLLETSGREVKPEFVPLTDEEQMRWANAAIKSQDHGEVHCIKTHLPLEFPEQVLSQIRIITPYRDLRDAALSFIRFMDCDFEQALRAVEQMKLVTGHYLSLPKKYVHEIKYEEMFRDAQMTIKKMADFLEINIEEDKIKTIEGIFSKENVKIFIGNLGDEIMNMTASGKIRRMDRRTGFQTSHIAENHAEKWSDVFSETEKAVLLSLTEDWLLQHGYSLS